MTKLILLALATIFIGQITTSPVSLKSKLEGCGVTASCMGIPGGCLDTDDCTAAASVVKDDDGVYTFEVTSIRGIYVAVGISLDATMGGTTVVECLHEPSSSEPESVALTTSYNIPGGWGNFREEVPGVTLVSGSYVNNAVSCKFTRDASTTSNSIVFDLDSDEYHMLLAVGNQVTASGSLLYHDVTRAASYDKRFFHEIGIFEV